MKVKTAFVLSAVSLSLSLGAYTIDDKVTAGNIIVDRIDGDTAYIHQDQRGTIKESWFYWGFRVKGAAGKTVKFVFTDKGSGGGPVGVRGPMVSTDGGKTFSYPLDGKTSVDSFTYTFAEGADEVRFYETYPYVATDWNNFISRYESERGKKFVSSVLCKSRKGADVPAFRFGCIDREPKYRIFMSARHHCSESTASFVLEGVVAAFMAEDEKGAWLRENVELMMVPMMDYDGVQAGDQGKLRAPHDHNRDYTEFIYPETKATSEWIKSHAKGKLDILLDVHCPWIRGKYNEFLYTPWKDPEYVANDAAEHRFSNLLEELQCGSMNYKASDDLMFGVSWNKGKNYGQGLSLVNWTLRNVKVAKVCRSLEVPFANANGAVVTDKTCRELGNDLTKVFRKLLAE